jgi:hypothetical protein
MNQPSYYSKFQAIANNVMHVDTVVFRSEAVLMMPETIRPETLLVDEKILIITSWM